MAETARYRWFTTSLNPCRTRNQRHTPRPSRRTATRRRYTASRKALASRGGLFPLPHRLRHRPYEPGKCFLAMRHVVLTNRNVFPMDAGACRSWGRSGHGRAPGSRRSGRHGRAARSAAAVGAVREMWVVVARTTDQGAARLAARPRHGRNPHAPWSVHPARRGASATQQGKGRGARAAAARAAERLWESASFR
jgi:hypothetical protein